MSKWSPGAYISSHHQDSSQEQDQDPKIKIKIGIGSSTTVVSERWIASVGSPAKTPEPSDRLELCQQPPASSPSAASDRHPRGQRNLHTADLTREQPVAATRPHAARSAAADTRARGQQAPPCLMRENLTLQISAQNTPATRHLRPAMEAARKSPCPT